MKFWNAILTIINEGNWKYKKFIDKHQFGFTKKCGIIVLNAANLIFDGLDFWKGFDLFDHHKARKQYVRVKPLLFPIHILKSPF